MRFQYKNFFKNIEITKPIWYNIINWIPTIEKRFVY